MKKIQENTVYAQNTYNFRQKPQKKQTKQQIICFTITPNVAQ
jgi:hypothetical protein